MSMPRSATTRRAFVKGAAAILAAPYFIPRSAFGANERLNLAWVGIGSQGYGNLSSFGGENVVAICDADGGALANAAKKWPQAKLYKDFRVMYREMGKQMDAVGVATTDHAHFPAAYMAMAMGKHVFVQKPLAHSIWEVRQLQQIAQKNKVITQMGNQGHASEGIRLIKEWYEAGLIGDVTEIIAWTNRPNGGFGFKNRTFTAYPPAQPVPAHLDWDLWLGPVGEPVPFSNEIHPLFWRGWWAFGCGGLGDIGCHTLDAPFWALNLGSPTRIDVKVESVNPVFTPKGSVVTYHFPARGAKPPVKVTWYEGPARPPKPDLMGGENLNDEGGMIMIGDKGAIAHPGMRPDSPRLYPEEKWQEFKNDPAKRPPKTLPRAKGGIFGDWANAIKNGGTPCSNFDYAAPLTEMIILGTLAIRTGKSVEFDSKNMKITNNPEAHALLEVPARKGWDLASLV